jgi:hypothetical protein
MQAGILGPSLPPDHEEKIIAALRVCCQHLNNLLYWVDSNCNSCGRFQWYSVRTREHIHSTGSAREHHRQAMVATIEDLE